MSRRFGSGLGIGFGRGPRRVAAGGQGPHAAAWRIAPAAAWLLAIVAGCGGGELLLIIVTPLNGVWRENGSVLEEGIQINSTSGGDARYDHRYAVNATLLGAPDSCGGVSGNAAVEGAYDNGLLELRPVGLPAAPPCIRGRFSSMIRFDAEANGSRPARFYRNDRVDLQLAEGLWSDATGSVRLKFRTLFYDGASTDPNADGTSISNGATGVLAIACEPTAAGLPTLYSGRLSGYVEAAGASPARKPTITDLGSASAPSGTPARFTAVVFEDAATLSIRTATGQSLTLTRRREAAGNCE